MLDSYECYCDYEVPDWIKVRQVKAARIAHKCTECHRWIRWREPYEYVCGKWEGDIFIFHICKQCQELREWAIISVPCFCYAYGMLHESVRDMVDEVAPGIPGFKEEYLNRLAKIKGRA